MQDSQAPDSGIILKDKQAKILLYLRDNADSSYISNLAEYANATYVHTCNFINTCEQLGIVKSERHGKIKQIRLTDKGIQIANLIANMYSWLQSAKQMAGQAADEQQKPAAETKL
ncbi:MAG: MarR family winged helix-turn-helix transcriptional regulator [Candidatus Marsarchaeota archaeon]|jgi:predicted transcriptional regulator|nr:MarR family winged helix-turn-helix transcriptional regulator [Candidatus Marsarchaeota archaeon]MCL5434599.1 MarR family winged helix-turn-helix transcriptional regulator [Candidatus Marsarchaeota archaeon]